MKGTFATCLVLAILVPALAADQSDWTWPSTKAPGAFPPGWTNTNNIPFFYDALGIRVVIFRDQGVLQGPIEFGNRGEAVIMCLLAPPAWTFQFRLYSKTDKATLATVDLNHTASVLTLGTAKYLGPPFPSWWGCISLAFLNNDYALFYVMDTTLWPVYHIKKNFPLPTDTFGGIEIHSYGPTALSMKLPEVAALFTVMATPECNIPNCSRCSDIASCAACEKDYFLSYDKGWCLPNKCLRTASAHLKECQDARPCEGYQSKAMCAAKNCKWCNLTGTCSNTTCECSILNLVSCQLNFQCKACITTQTCMDNATFNAECSCARYKDSDSCTFPCTWCSDTNTCAQSGLECGNCSKISDPVNCNASSCSWCKESKTCVPTADLCMHCDTAGMKFYCDEVPDVCGWSETDEVCYTLPSQMPSKTCDSLNRTECTSTECIWCPVLKRCSTRPDCFSCGLESQSDCNQTECYWSNMLSTCVSANFVESPCSELTSKSSCGGFSHCQWCESKTCILNGTMCPPEGLGGGSIAAIVVVPSIVFIAGALTGLVFLWYRQKHAEATKDEKRLELLNAEKLDLGSQMDGGNLGLEVLQVLSFGVMHVEKATAQTFQIKNLLKEPFKVVFIAPKAAQFAVSFVPPRVTLPVGEITSVKMEITPSCTTVINSQFVIAREAIGHCLVPFKGEVALSTQLDWEEVIVEKTLGEGAFGVVKSGKWRNTPVAIKEVKEVVMLSPQWKDEMKREIGVMTSLRSPYLVNFFGTCQQNGRVAYIMELAPFGSLGSLLNPDSPLPEWFQIKVALDAARGMTVLHANGIMHRDLKPDNVLIFDMGKAEVNGKLTDFGTARAISDDAASNEHTRGVGTPVYMAPEILDSQAYGPPADVYSFALLMWHMVHLQVPYQDHGNHFGIVTFVLEGKRLACSETSVLSPLIKQCWAHDPKERPTFPSIVESLTLLSK